MQEVPLTPTTVCISFDEQQKLKEASEIMRAAQNLSCRSLATIVAELNHIEGDEKTWLLNVLNDTPTASLPGFFADIGYFLKDFVEAAYGFNADEVDDEDED